MRVARLTWLVLLAVVLATSTGTAPAGGDSAVFPFVAGTTWTYAGTVKWTHDGNHVSSGAVRWTSEVADAFDDGDVAAVLLEGTVWDLAWWSPDASPKNYLVLRVGARYYGIYDDAKAVFAAVKESGRKALPLNLEQTLWFEAPLRPGRIYRAPGVAERGDKMNGWSIEAAETRAAYVLRYDTLPDEEKLTLVPGVGITSFAYLHHGTVAEADVHLVAFHRGGPSRTLTSAR